MTSPINGFVSSAYDDKSANATSMYTNKTKVDAGSKSVGDQDTFLKLLVAQLKYQDPSNPADSTQFLAQTAQFTQVEKLGLQQDGRWDRQPEQAGRLAVDDELESVRLLDRHLGRAPGRRGLRGRGAAGKGRSQADQQGGDREAEQGHHERPASIRSRRGAEQVTRAA